MTGPALFAALGAVLAAAAQLAVTTGRAAVVMPLALVAATALILRRRWRAGSAGEVLMLIGLGVSGMVLQGLAPNAVGEASAPLRSAMFIFAWTGLGAAALRLHLDRPEGGAAATLAGAGIVFLACGTVRTGLWLPRLFPAYLLLALCALVLDAWQQGRAPAPWRWRGRHAWVAALLVVAMPLVMLAWAGTGPRMIRGATAWALERVGPSHGTGFHEGPITLHALDGLLQSDTVVMRVYGDTRN